MPKHPGLAVMLHMLGGNQETVEAHNGAIGKTIRQLDLVQGDDIDRLAIRFTDGTGICFYDDGQSCCENRWMATDDDLAAFVGAEFLGAELRDGPEYEKGWETHEEQFLLVNTSLGTFTMVTYNEHNGYYGGFAVVVRELPQEENDA